MFLVLLLMKLKRGQVMQYNEFYQRNIGIFTEDEQAKLKSAKVVIAGVGGAGGIQAVTLARMGIGEITIIDPGIYDEPDMNRQYGAMASTLGKNKALVTGKMLKDIAPFAKINIFDRKLTEDELRLFIKDASLVVDAIDLADFPYKDLFSRIAREESKYNLSCPLPDFGAILMILDPDGMTFNEFTNGKRYPPMTPGAIARHKNGEISEGISFFSSISTNSGAAALSASLLSIEAALIIVGKRKKEELITIPNVIYIDLFSRFFQVVNPWIVNKI